MLNRVLAAVLVLTVCGSTGVVSVVTAARPPDCDDTVPKQVPCVSASDYVDCKGVTSGPTACVANRQLDVKVANFDYVSVVGSNKKAAVGGKVDCKCEIACQWSNTGQGCIVANMGNCVADTTTQEFAYYDERCCPIRPVAPDQPHPTCAEGSGDPP